jgi:hypothetical protein
VRTLVLAVMLVIPLSLGGCPGHHKAPSPSEQAKSTACPGLASVLQELSESTEPAAFAAQRGLDWVDGSVRVVAEVSGSPPLPDSVVLELATGPLLQVLVPPDALCPLANTDGVQRVRLPLTPTPPSQEKSP